MNYKQLIKILESMPKEKLNDDVTVYFANDDEYYGIESIQINNDTNVIDNGHIYIKIV